MSETVDSPVREMTTSSALTTVIAGPSVAVIVALSRMSTTCASSGASTVTVPETSPLIRYTPASVTVPPS